jgi:hypothetical protein
MQSTYPGFQQAVNQCVAKSGLLMYDEATTFFQMKPATEAQGTLLPSMHVYSCLGNTVEARDCVFRSELYCF